MAKIHRKLWENIHGKIPVDVNGRTYEIHHLDGNHNNNDIENLACLSIDDHYKIHYDNGDYGACVMIAKRMLVSPEFISNIQRGVKRPGVGGVKKGTIPWNKGKPGYTLNMSESGKLKKIQAVKNKAKIKDDDVLVILELYNNKVHIDNDEIGKIKRNGKAFSYERAFSRHYSTIYGVCEQYIFQIITNKDNRCLRKITTDI